MRLWLAIALTALLALPSNLAQAQSTDREWEDCLGKDQNLIIQGCTAVINRGNRATKRVVANGYTWRGAAYENIKQFEEAIRDYNSAIRVDPTSDYAYDRRGKIHQSRGNFDAAITDYNKAIRLDPKFVFYYLDRASLQHERGNLDAAIADYDIAIRLDPKNASAHNSRGITLRKRGDIDAALAEYNAAIRLDPNEATTYGNRGNLYSNSDNDSAALIDYSTAIRLNPNWPDVYYNRGIHYKDRGDLSLALADFRRAAELGFVQAQVQVAELERQIAATGPSPSAAPLQVATVSRPASPVASAGTVAIAPSRRVALVIGNSDYQNVAFLPNPRRDADTVAAALRAAGFQSVQVEKDLKLADLTAALRTFELQADQADWAVVYFAGHGIEVNGINHLVPVDARLRSDRDVADETVTLGRVLERIENARTLRLVILDACRDSPFLVRMQRVASRSIGRGLAPVEDATAGTLVAYAARAGQVAQDGDGTNSPFVQALVHQLAEPGLELSLLFRKVRDDVMATTGKRQEPFTYGSLPGQPLFFNSTR